MRLCQIAKAHDRTRKISVKLACQRWHRSALPGQLSPAAVSPNGSGLREREARDRTFEQHRARVVAELITFVGARAVDAPDARRIIARTRLVPARWPLRADELDLGARVGS